MNIQALILAAGDSKRLKSLTKDMPKSFLEINNKKIIEHHLDKISESGITTATIVVGFMKEQFKKEIGFKYKNINIEYIDCDEYSSWNHGWSFYLSKRQIIKNNKNVLVVHADTFYDYELLDLLLKKDEENLILADSEYTIKTNDELLVYGENNSVSGLFFSNEKKPNPIGEFVGLHKMKLDSFILFCDFLESYFMIHGKKIGYDRILSDFIVESNTSMTYKTLPISWININYEEDYFYAKKLHRAFNNPRSLYQKRITKLKSLIQSKNIVRIMEAHNGLTGLIVEKTQIKSNNEVKEFDGMWLSSLTHSAIKGKPDIQYVDITLISNTLNEIFDVTTKPMIVDADSGGLSEHFVFVVKTLERLGVSAVIIEDKKGAKRNSLFGTAANQTQDDINNFSSKISAGKRAQVTKDFMIIARIESLILKQGEADALKRAKAYIAAGADAIMIHSKEEDPEEIISFVTNFRKEDQFTPIVVVPTSYNKITESRLSELGVNVVIYANHLLRSAYPAMTGVAKSILTNGRSFESNSDCMSIKKIINLIPGA